MTDDIEVEKNMTVDRYEQGKGTMTQLIALLSEKSSAEEQYQRRLERMLLKSDADGYEGGTLGDGWASLYSFIQDEAKKYQSSHAHVVTFVIQRLEILVKEQNLAKTYLVGKMSKLERGLDRRAIVLSKSKAKLEGAQTELDFTRGSLISLSGSEAKRTKESAKIKSKIEVEEGELQMLKQNFADAEKDYYGYLFRVYRPQMQQSFARFSELDARRIYVIKQTLHQFASNQVTLNTVMNEGTKRVISKVEKIDERLDTLSVRRSIQVRSAMAQVATGESSNGTSGKSTGGGSGGGGWGSNGASSRGGSSLSLGGDSGSRGSLGGGGSTGSKSSMHYSSKSLSIGGMEISSVEGNRQRQLSQTPPPSLSTPRLLTHSKSTNTSEDGSRSEGGGSTKSSPREHGAGPPSSNLTAKALFNFIAADASQLFFSAGDEIENVTTFASTHASSLGIPSSYWMWGEAWGSSGIFPANFVEVMYDEPLTGVALFSFHPTQDQELALSKGDKLTVSSVSGDGWCRGSKVDGSSGLFPNSFVQLDS